MQLHPLAGAVKATLDPWRYLRLVMQCLPIQPANRIAELLPWNPHLLMNVHRDQALAT